MWFKKLTGFTEKSPAQVRANMKIKGNQLSSKINGKTYTYGRLETPSLKELRSRSSLISPSFKGRLVLSELVADVSELHKQENNSGCLVQAASQFNLLEMVAPSVSPEAGVDIYVMLLLCQRSYRNLICKFNLIKYAPPSSYTHPNLKGLALFNFG